MFSAVSGGWSPQTPSMRPPIGTASLAWASRMARTARWRGPPSGAGAPSATASSGPRIRYSSPNGGEPNADSGPAAFGPMRDNGSMAGSIAPSSLTALLAGPSRRPAGLADGLRALVVDGRLAVRTRVPSERALASELRISRGSVSRAYDRLRDEGYLASRRGAGSWLTLPGGGGPGPLPSPPGGVEGAPLLDLTVAALPAPTPLLAEAAARAADGLRRHVHAHGYTSLGLPELREAVAARLTARGLPTSAGEVLVTA